MTVRLSWGPEDFEEFCANNYGSPSLWAWVLPSPVQEEIGAGYHTTILKTDSLLVLEFYSLQPLPSFHCLKALLLAQIQLWGIMDLHCWGHPLGMASLTGWEVIKLSIFAVSRVLHHADCGNSSGSCVLCLRAFGKSQSSEDDLSYFFLPLSAWASQELGFLASIPLSGAHISGLLRLYSEWFQLGWSDFLPFKGLRAWACLIPEYQMCEGRKEEEEWASLLILKSIDLSLFHSL